MEDLLQIDYANTSNRDIACYPVTYGVPLAPGRLQDASKLAVRTPAGELLAVQAEPLELHPDGSVKWVLLDFGLPLAANETGRLAVVSGADVEPEAEIASTATATGVSVTTAALTASFSTERFGLFQSYQAGDKECVLPGSDIVVEDKNGKRFYASLAPNLEMKVAVQGPLRTVVEATGRHTAEDDSQLLDFRVRYTFLPHEPGVRIAYKFTNAEAPEQGVWLRSIRLVLPTALGDTTTKHVRQHNHGDNWWSRLIEVRENVELMNYGATNDEAKARYGSAAEGKVVIRNFESLGEDVQSYPYYLRPGNARTDMSGGLRQVYPHLMANGAGGSAIAWFFEMELHYPKAQYCERNVLTWDVWPHWAGDLQWRRGMSKEHELYVSLSGQPRSAEELEAVYFGHEITGGGVLGGPHAPATLALDVEYARETEILDLHRWLRYDIDKYVLVEEKLGSAGARGSVGSRGMMDVGDSVNNNRSWSHNNENDAILNGLREYYRRGEPTLLYPALLKARHNAHIDFIATDPNPLRQGTMPAHCPEHTDGATYPSHMWVDGLLAAYCITGETDLRQAALAVGENMRRWQQQGSDIFYADSREAGWPMLAFLRLHEHTGEQRWLDYCEEVFVFFRDFVNEEGAVVYAMPHGIGNWLSGYGEFIAWRAIFRYYERTGREDVKAFLIKCFNVDKVYKITPDRVAKGGWACNDLFPAWAAYELTGDDHFITDNYPVFRLLMKRAANFPWGGVDMHYYLNELDRRGALEDFV